MIDNDFQSSVLITSKNEVDVLYTINRISYVNEIASEAEVPSASALDVIFNLLQPPITKIPAPTVNDSYIRLDRPTLNYGTAQTIVLGTTLGDEYRSLFEFDISNVYTLVNAELAIADIVLKFTSLYDPTIEIELYAITQTWDEASVTWTNFTQELINPISSFNVNTQTLRIDTLPYVRSLMQQGKTRLGIVLKVKADNPDALFYISSKEAPDLISRPQLDLGAKPIGWFGYLGDLNLDSVARMRALRNRDLYSESHIRNHNNLDSTVRRGYTTSNELTSNAQSFISNDFKSNDIISRVTARTGKDIDSSSIIKISKSIDLPSNSIIRQVNDLNSETIARIVKIRDILSKVFIRKLTITYSDIVSSAGILEPAFKHVDLNSRIQIFENNEVDSTAIVYNKSDLNSRIQIFENNDIDSQSNIFNKFDVLGNMVVRRYENYDADSKLEIYNFKDLESLADLFNWGQLDSSSIVRRKELTDLLSSVISRQFDISELHSVVWTHTYEHFNMDSKCYLVGLQIDDKICHVIVMYRMYEDLTSSVQVNNTARYWIPNVHGNEIFKFGDRNLPRIWVNTL